jgi:two-component system OmpR family response regulator
MKASAFAAVLPWDAPREQRHGNVRVEPMGPRILVVDDDESVQELVTQTLESAGFRTGIAGSMQDAQERALDEDYSGMVLDLILPDSNGLTLYRRLQRLRPQLAPRTVFITGMLDDEEIGRFVKRVGNPLLVKPFDLDALVQAVRRAVSTPFV